MSDATIGWICLSAGLSMLVWTHIWQPACKTRYSLKILAISLALKMAVKNGNKGEEYKYINSTLNWITEHGLDFGYFDYFMIRKLCRESEEYYGGGDNQIRMVSIVDGREVAWNEIEHNKSSEDPYVNLNMQLGDAIKTNMIYRNIWALTWHFVTSPIRFCRGCVKLFSVYNYGE
jgi:hypothetical protein